MIEFPPYRLDFRAGRLWRGNHPVALRPKAWALLADMEAAADAGLTHCRDTAERLFEAELWRLRGEFILRRAPTRGQARQAVISEADECFEKARAVSRTQGAQMLERRACRRDLGIATCR